MNNELIREIEVYERHCFMSGQLQVADLIQRTRAALSQREAEPVATVIVREGQTSATYKYLTHVDAASCLPIGETDLYAFPPKPAALPQGLKITGAEGGYGFDRPMMFSTSSQDVEEFIAQSKYTPFCESCEGDAITVSDLRAWMAGHVRAKLPAAMDMEPFQTVDKASKNYKAGWNACRIEMLAAQYLQTVEKGLIVDERV